MRWLGVCLLAATLSSPALAVGLIGDQNTVQGQQVQPVYVVNQASFTVSLGSTTITLSTHTSVDNFPANQAVTVTNIPAIQDVSGSTVNVGNFPSQSTFTYVTNIATHVSVDNTITTTTHTWVDNLSTHTSVDNFPATQDVSGSTVIAVIQATVTASIINFPAQSTFTYVTNIATHVSVDNTIATSTHVSVDNFPATQAVTGTFFQATQPISGTVAVNNFPAVSTFTYVNNIATHVSVDNQITVTTHTSVDNFPATQAVTGTFFQATQPISGAVSILNLPATSTVTFNGVSQPVTVGNFPTASTFTYVTNIATHVTVDNQVVTSTHVAVDNFPALQQVAGIVTASLATSTFTLVNIATVTVSGQVQTSTHVIVDNQVTVSTHVTVDNFPAVQAVAGTVTASLATSTFTLVNAATVTFNGAQPIIITNQASTFTLVNVATVTVSGNVNSFTQNTTTITFNGVTQPVTVGNFPAASTFTFVNNISTHVTVDNQVAESTFTSVNNFPAVQVTVDTTSANNQGIINSNMTNGNLRGTVNAVVTDSTFSLVGTATVTVNNALTKGTQGTVGLSTQDLKDAGRTYVVLVATGVAGVTTEALFSFQQNKGGTVTQSVTSYTITSGKTLRIQGLYCSNRDGAATISWTRANIRSSIVGATVAASALVFGLETGGSGALTGATGDFAALIPDGLEIAGNGTVSIGVSHLDQATTNLVTCTLVGYEY